MTRREFTPRPFQPMCFDHLLEHKRCALWAPMGMSKTSSTLTVLDALYLSGAETRPTLIPAPLRVARDTWADEAAKWNHLSGMSVSPIVGSEKERLAALRKDAAIFPVNYENLPWLVEHWGPRWPYGPIVADEAGKLRGFRTRQGTSRARALAMVAHKYATRFIELNGTPSPNGLKNLWGQLWFLDAGQRLGRTYSAFQERWFQAVPGGDGYSQIKPLPFAQEQIQDAVRDICLSLNVKDWFDVADPIIKPVFVDLPPKARKLYDDMEKRLFAEIEGHPVEAFNAAARTGKCLQLANGAAYVDDKGKWVETHTAKLDALDSIVEEAAGMPVLCGYEFVSDRERILKAFPKAVDLATAEGMVRFKTGKSPLGIGHAASIGHGVDGLQDVTNIMAFFGHTWDLELYAQFVERIGPVRQMQSGYDREVLIYPIIARDTLDESVIARRENKRSVQDLLLEACNRAKAK